jgi:hypothetical protein
MTGPFLSRLRWAVAVVTLSASYASADPITVTSGRFDISDVEAHLRGLRRFLAPMALTPFVGQASRRTGAAILRGCDGPLDAARSSSRRPSWPADERLAVPRARGLDQT